MKLNKNIMIAILLLSVFAVGTISFADTVEAAKWKKFDSGTLTPSSGTYSLDSSFKQNKVLFVSYIKGSSTKTKFYAYKKSNNKKVLESTCTITRTATKVKLTSVDYKGNKQSVSENLTSLAKKENIKLNYKVFISSFKNAKSTYLTSLKSTSTSNSGSKGNTGLRQVYVPAEYGYVYKWSNSKYNPSTNTYGGYDYVWDVVKPGHWEYK